MKTLLDHSMIKITEEGTELKVKIKMLKGGWVLNRPFPADLRGTIGALTLALDVISGKVILESIAIEDTNVAQEMLTVLLAESTTKLIGGK